MYFDDWLVGEEVPIGKITQILGGRKDEYILYEVDNKKEVRFDTHPDIGPRKFLIETEWTEASILLTTAGVKERYFKRMAVALGACFQERTEIAKEKLVTITADIHDFKTTRGRIAYLQGTYIFAAFVITILLLCVNYIFKGDQALLLNVTVYAILGGVLSVSINLSSIVINTSSEDRWMDAQLGAVRVIISGVSGVLMFALLKSDLIMGVLTEQSQFAYFAFGAISGFSENYVANILKKVKKGSEEEGGQS